MINYMELEIVLQISPTRKLEHATSLQSVTFVGRNEFRKKNTAPRSRVQQVHYFPLAKTDDNHYYKLILCTLIIGSLLWLRVLREKSNVVSRRFGVNYSLGF